MMQYFAMKRPASHVAELDGLRALAIILVLLRHGVNPFYSGAGSLMPVGSWDPGILFTNGWAGVDLFFVLSGYLIASHLLRQRAAFTDGRALRAYLAQRALRIVPAFYAVLLIAALGLVPHYTVAAGDLWRRVGYHLLFMQDYLPADIVVAFWSLGVEEKFYLTIPVVLAILLRVRRPAHRCGVLAALICLVPVARYATARAHDVTTYVELFTVLRSPFHLSADALLMGALAALIVDAQRASGRVPRRLFTALLFWGGSALAACLLLAVPHMDRIGTFDVSILPTLLAAGFGAVVLAVTLTPERHGAWLRARWLHVVARLSYTLYLVHLLVIPGVRVALASHFAMDGMPASTQFLLFLPVYLAASLVASVVLHYVVEKPFLVLKDAMQRRETGRAGHTAARSSASRAPAAGIAALGAPTANATHG